MSARAPRAAFDAETIRNLVRGKRFLAADRADLDLGEIATWDSHLLREHRLLVPIDVQALYVQPGNQEKMVRLPMLLAGADGKVAATIDAGMPEPFAEGELRPPGVHLHWAMPDALLRGRFEQRPDAAVNRLALPVLPDRWVLLRIVLPREAGDVAVTGWVLEADRAVATPLAAWREGKPALAPDLSPTPAGATVAKERLTGTVGGAVAWSGVYDAVLNRFAFHDPLTDLDALAPQGVDEDCASYLVAGWWSDPAHDPLDQARGKDSLHELLDRLRWRLLHEWGDAKWAQERQQAQFELRKALGLVTAERWSGQRPIVSAGKTRAVARATAATVAYTPIAATFIEQPMLPSASFFATEAAKRYVAAPWQLRSSLLHGVIHGVPVKGDPFVDRRPAPDALSVAIGHHDDDLLAAFAAPPPASTERRRATERLLAAFTTQKINRLASADGLVELEEHEHAVAFASLPGGSAGTDRYLQRVQTGGVGGLALGKKSKFIAEAMGVAALKPFSAPERHARPAEPGAARAAGNTLAGDILFATGGKPSFIKANEMAINDLARSRVGDVLAPTEARVVDRPAPRFTFANEPMVAIRGASRSLRHGGDGRGSADGKLTCRWPTHVIGEIPGLIAMDRFVRTLGSGATPSEVLTLAREAVLHDPYHDEWVARAVTQPGQDRRAILSRLRAESALRYGYDGTYDGATQAFHPGLAKTPAARRRQAAAPLPVEPGVRQTQTRLADELRRFSVYKGADPDLVGVTTWAQPWVPMWLEWEVMVEGLDPPTLAAWQLGSIDLESVGAGIEGDTAVLRGRALLTTGAAATLHDAIADWLKAEDALDAVHAGLVDEETEDKLRILDEAVRHLDVVTAALDGVRGQLLGFDLADGLRRPGAGGTVSHPAPQRAPRALLAGAVSLTRARLLDAFGRTLEVPLANVATPTRATQDGQPGRLAMTPRLLRPARWLFRLVDAATAVGTEGTEARVDQIEPSLQINPVAGFVMPDHLDESLEVFGVRRFAPGRTAARGGKRRRDLGDRRRTDGPRRCRAALWADIRATGAGAPCRRPGGRRRAGAWRRGSAGRRSDPRVGAVGAAARHRHHALERRYLRRAGQRTCGRLGRTTRGGGASPVAPGVQAGRRR